MERSGYLTLAIVVGVLSGGTLGSLLPTWGVALGFIGELFLNALKMVAIPLIIVSIMLSTMRLGGGARFASTGVRVFLYYAATTALAVATGIALVVFVKPGLGVEPVAGSVPEGVARGGASIGEFVLSFIDPNLFDAAANFRILPLITASLLFGIAFVTLGKEGAAVEAVLSAVDKAIVKVVGWVMWLAPLGIMALIAERIGKEGGGGAALELALHIGGYFFSVVLGLVVHGFISLPLILFLLARENPFSYMAGFARALLTALATASSSATLPVTVSCAEGRGLPSRVARFVLPLGATVNMDGTALYEAVAAIFIAQSYGVVLGGGELLIVFVTATAAAVGAAGIPEAGLTTMVLVLTAVGLPVEGIGLILAVDWLLDRARTAINVWGDAVGAAVVARWEGKDGG